MTHITQLLSMLFIEYVNAQEHCEVTLGQSVLLYVNFNWS